MPRFVHSNRCRCGSDRIPLDETNAWWISAPDYNNCFWTYLRNNDREHTLSEIAKLLKLSISAITSIEKKALSKVRKKVSILKSNK